MAGNSAETEQAGKRIDGQTGGSQEVFHAGVGSGPLDTSVRFSLQSWAPSERDEERETGSQGGAIKTLSGRGEGGGNTDEG